MKLTEILGDIIKQIKAPSKFKVGDKFQVYNNGKDFSIEVLSLRDPHEVEIISNGKKSFTDTFALSGRLRDAESFKKIS